MPLKELRKDGGQRKCLILKTKEFEVGPFCSYPPRLWGQPWEEQGKLKPPVKQGNENVGEESEQRKISFDGCAKVEEREQLRRK